MTKRGFLDRFIRISKPTGKPQWGHALRAISLMVLAGLIAKFLGFDNGIQAVMFVTLLASIIIDISLPIRKVAILALLGLFMTILAFLSSSLALSSLPIFIFFTVLWAFFGISLYIFGSMEGSLGFTFFLIYFISVLLVNNQSTPLDWANYAVLSYLVVSILFIPKLWREKSRIRGIVTLGFIPSSSIQNVLSNMNILSGIPINSNYYDIFKLGAVLKILRNYGDLLADRMTSKSKLYFTDFLNSSDKSSIEIANNFKNKKGKVDLKELNSSLSIFISHIMGNNRNEAIIELSQSISDILDKSNEILIRNPEKKLMKIKVYEKSFKEVIGANFNLKNQYIRHAIRFTLAITISLIFIYLTRERNAIWITMGILIILKPDISSTIENLYQRVGFNFLAIILAIILSFIFPHEFLVWLAFIMLFLFRAFYPNYMGLSVMAMTVFIVLIWPTGTVFDNAILRIVDISIGGLIAFICAYIILPNRVTLNLPELLTSTVRSNVEYADQVLVDAPDDFNKEKIAECFKAFIQKENNLEAALKKLEDTFNDINDDLTLYKDIISSNIKLAADITVIAGILSQKPEEISGKHTSIIEVKKLTHDLEKSIINIDKYTKTPKYNSSFDYSNYNKTNDLDQIINWVKSDLKLIHNGFEIAYDNDLLKRYTKLT